ncbi:ankyrin repeat domain-containing protein [Candidatus Mesenet endosymbiont of Agriotes lineatus]|uniref:ankyrin repeat domain-containing protein n=1 Tax=Candidatus Mesenet endosymbiont of Agriotes lineatus TaxID=3077948 RepID=UPI0030D269F7
MFTLQYDYDPDNKENLGTILHWAAQNNKPDIFETLKPYIESKRGIFRFKPKNQYINQGYNQNNETPLHHAVDANNIKMVEYLLAVPGIDVNALNKYGYNSLIYARNTENAEMVLLLVNAGIDIKSKKAQIALVETMMGFAKKGDTKSLEKLLSHELLKDKIDVNVRASVGDYNNATMLAVAAWQGNIEMLKMLRKYGADANLKGINEGDNGRATLHYIVQEYSKTEDPTKKNNIKDVMTLLVLLFDADLTLKDNKGKAPLDYLQDQDLRKYLEDIAAIDNIVIKKCEKYVNDLFKKGHVALFEKEATSEKRIRFNEYFSKEVFKNLGNVDKKNFFLSIISNSATSYEQFISEFKSWLLEKDPKKSIVDHVKNLDDNFDQLMDEYIHDSGSPAKRADSKDNPSTSFKSAEVKKNDKNCTIL